MGGSVATVEASDRKGPFGWSGRRAAVDSIGTYSSHDSRSS